MIWWFLLVAVAAGAMLWAALSAYVMVRERLINAENRPAGAGGKTRHKRTS
jgi:hypothetical protein